MKYPYMTAAVLVSGNLLGCAGIEMERIPTQEDIRSWDTLQAFIIQAETVTGLYQNIDVDSVVFSYGSAASEVAFWQELDQLATAQGWIGTTAKGSLRVYARLKERGSLAFSSAEELRVSYSASQVVVGYVQSDQDGSPRPVAEASEGRFAKKYVWPKFEEAVSRNAG